MMSQSDRELSPEELARIEAEAEELVERAKAKYPREWAGTPKTEAEHAAIMARVLELPPPLVEANGVPTDDAQPPAEFWEDGPAEVKITLEGSALTGIDLAKPLPELDYIVRTLAMPAGAGAAHIFGGFGFSGKTVAAQQMMLALAADRLVWKAYGGPGRPYRVIHVDNEQGVALTQRRYQRLANGHGVSLEELGDRLALRTYPKLTDGTRLILKPEHRGYWGELMSGRDLILIDSFAASRGGEISENASEVRRALDMLGELSEETKCRPLVIHHANKVGDERPGFEPDARQALRGSGGIFDAGDSIYLLSGKKNEAIKAEQIKARSHGEPCPDFALVIEDVERAEGTHGAADPKWGLAVGVHGAELIEEQREIAAEAKAAAKLAKNAAKIRKVLAGGVRLGSRELQAACRGMRKDAVDAAFDFLVTSGEAVRTEEKVGRTHKYLHALTTSGGVR
jgi:hypothetical protein